MYKEGDYKNNIRVYAQSSLFNTNTDHLIHNNPFHRPIYDQYLIDRLEAHSKFSGPSQLLLHRVLFNIYEHDLFFLPTSTDQEAYFEKFYSDEIYLQGEIIRPELEKFLIEKSLTGFNKTTSYSKVELFDIFSEKINKAKMNESKLVTCIKTADNPRDALHYFLIQCAGDFLTEASGMARNLPGNFGALQSELFKIFIDEYGYGVHRTKHSTAYEKLLQQQGLSSIPHTYWNYYLTSSLALHNYIHFVCKNHRNFFRYIGALYYAEATYSSFCGQISKLIKEICGADAETFYFDEHHHIDQHHSRMVSDSLIVPIIKQFGDKYNSELLQGFMEFEYFLTRNEAEIIKHIRYFNNIAYYRSNSLLNQQLLIDTESTELAQSFFSVADYDTCYQVLQGQFDLFTNIYDQHVLSINDEIIIPSGIHYGIMVKSPTKVKISRYQSNESQY